VKLPSVSTIEVFTELEVSTQRPLWRYWRKRRRKFVFSNKV